MYFSLLQHCFKDILRIHRLFVESEIYKIDRFGFLMALIKLVCKIKAKRLCV